MRKLSLAMSRLSRRSKKIQKVVLEDKIGPLVVKANRQFGVIELILPPVGGYPMANAYISLNVAKSLLNTLSSIPALLPPDIQDKPEVQQFKDFIMHLEDAAIETGLHQTEAHLPLLTATIGQNYG